MGTWDGDSRPIGAPAAGRIIRWEDCPIMALGHRDGIHWFFSPSGELREIPYRNLYKRDGLEDLFEGDLKWLYENFAGDSGNDLAVMLAGRALLQQSVRAGLFDHRRIDAVGDGGDQNVGRLHGRDELVLGAGHVVDIQVGIEQLAHPCFDGLRQFARDDDFRSFLGRHFLNRPLVESSLTNRQ